MLTDYLQDRAAQYVSGDLSTSDREQFELLLEFHQELRDHVTELGEVGASLTLAAASGHNQLPSPGLKSRIAAAISDRPQQKSHPALVVSGANGLVEWVNSAFSEMCGYSLDELRGRKLGPILQGADTDRATAGRMRAAVHAKQPCRETILNYHKDGTPYWVEIDIAPIVDDAGNTLWMLAREREVSERSAA